MTTVQRKILAIVINIAAYAVAFSIAHYRPSGWEIALLVHCLIWLFWWIWEARSNP